jgi:hypothetical protein
MRAQKKLESGSSGEDPGGTFSQPRIPDSSDGSAGAQGATAIVVVPVDALPDGSVQRTVSA